MGWFTNLFIDPMQYRVKPANEISIYYRTKNLDEILGRDNKSRDIRVRNIKKCEAELEVFFSKVSKYEAFRELITKYSNPYEQHKS